MVKSPAHDEIVEDLQIKIKTLHSSVWERRADWTQVLAWIDQFKGAADPAEDEQLQALRLLSNFMYFGVNEIRALLRSLYRDNYMPQVAKEIREVGAAPSTISALAPLVKDALSNTRYVPLGNPAESSSLLMYYFRQENTLLKDLFLHGSDIFDLSKVGAGGGVSLKHPKVTRYVFIDDLCGSGVQAKGYAENIVKPLKLINKNVRTYYYPVFGLLNGIKDLRDLNLFDVVYPIVELDESFRAFGANSRLFPKPEFSALRLATEKTCWKYGCELFPEDPLGFENSQLYIGFAHNTPDNTLPIFWSDHTGPKPWVPIFRRYPKVYQ